MLKGRTPLGWIQLTHNRTRFIVACAGVGVAVILVFMQLGFMNMLFDTTVLLHKQLKADIVLLSVEAKDMNQTGSFARRRLVQTLGVEGVQNAEPLYIATMNWTKPSNGESGRILMLAVPPDFDGFRDLEVQGQLRKLHRVGSFLFDAGSRGDYQSFINKIATDDQPQVEINHVKATAIGTFKFGASFDIEAIGITSPETFCALNQAYKSGVINIGLIHVAQGYDPVAVAARINASAGEEIRAMTMADFIKLSRNRLAQDSPIAIVFSFGTVVGLFVGAIIVVQILSSDVQDHLGEYATFKAMGFTNRYLLGIVYEQSTILTVFGFVPAFVLSLGLYQLVGAAAHMQMTMTFDRIVLVFCLTVMMCAVSGTIAIRRIFSADPAEVF